MKYKFFIYVIACNLLYISLEGNLHEIPFFLWLSLFLHRLLCVFLLPPFTSSRCRFSYISFPSACSRGRMTKRWRFSRTLSRWQPAFCVCPAHLKLETGTTDERDWLFGCILDRKEPITARCVNSIHIHITETHTLFYLILFSLYISVPYLWHLLHLQKILMKNPSCFLSQSNSHDSPSAFTARTRGNI